MVLDIYLLVYIELREDIYTICRMHLANFDPYGVFPISPTSLSS